MTRPLIDLPANSYQIFAALYDGGRFDRYSLSLADRVESLAEQYGPAVVEVACGTGSLLAGLYRSGRTVLGVDLSPDMLRYAKGKLDGRVVTGEMTALPVRGGWDLALCFYDSLNYLPDSDHLAATFQEFRRILRSGGGFSFDVNNRAAYEEVWAHSSPYEVDSEAGRITIRTSWDPARMIGEAVVDAEPGYGEDGIIYRSRHFQRCFESDEIERVLGKAGFKVRERETIDPFPEEGEFQVDAKDLWLVEAI